MSIKAIRRTITVLSAYASVPVSAAGGGCLNRKCPELVGKQSDACYVLHHMCRNVSMCKIDVAVKWPMGGRSLKHWLKSVQGITKGEHVEDIILTSDDRGVLVLNALTQVC